jgi:hypothetical protein
MGVANANFAVTAGEVEGGYAFIGQVSQVIAP